MLHAGAVDSLQMDGQQMQPQTIDMLPESKGHLQLAAHEQIIR